MPAASGVVGMSKSSILTGLANAGDRVARWTLIEPGTFPVRNAALRRFMAENGLSYPIVLKPDRGERGEGVVIAKTARETEAALREITGAIVAQAYVPGLEFGVFYVRRPGESTGEIFALTEKRDVHVTGDGRTTLQDLILADGRAVEMARFFLAEFRDRLDEIPDSGERVRLSELGTHCRGSLFLDGGGLVTSRLEQTIDAVSQTYGGFYFGRYDVRADSVESLQQGDFKVIELNGVTSEATGMYDPRHSVWHGWATLCHQWRLAFEIGASNRARGSKVWSIGELLGLLQEHKKS
ncbi:MAG: carboxylate--amine ligase [Synoicihabitans sp.]